MLDHEALVVFRAFFSLTLVLHDCRSHWLRTFNRLSKKWFWTELYHLPFEDQHQRGGNPREMNLVAGRHLLRGTGSS